MPPTWLLKLATGRNVTFALAVWLAFSLLFFNFGPYQLLRAASGSLDLLEELFGYTAKEGYNRIFILGEAGRALYQNFQWLDLVNAALTVIAFTLALTYTLRRLFPAGHAMQWLIWLPSLAGVGELIENFSLLAMLNLFPAEAPVLADLASIATQFKQTVGFACLPIIVLSFTMLAAQRFMGRGEVKHG
ncbi:MAG: hypothetical protein JNL09_03835 [Anaerolineales bacterium]|nr:hypothetical protein [Anaerolineales bacterium]